MHFSVAKTVTVALVGLGNVLLTTNAAPAGIVRARDPNVPDNHVPHHSDHVASLVVARSPKGGQGDSGPVSSWSDSSPDFSGSESSSADGPNPGGFGMPPPKDGSNSGSGSGSGNPSVAEGTVDLRGKQYDINKQSAADGSTNLQIREGGPEGKVVVDMSVNAKQDSYTIKEAWNKDDQTPNKPRLFEMVHSIWVNEMGRKPEDLDTVRLLSVTEDTTMPALSEAKDKKGGSNDFTVTRNSEDGVDKGIFDKLAQTTWGKHVQKVLDLGGSGKNIESFRVQNFNLAVRAA